MKSIPPKLLPWIEARSRFKLTHAEVQMARELGMNPKKLGGLANERQEPWKVPLRGFIANCYRKSYGRDLPERVRSIEELARDEQKRRDLKKAKKAALQKNDEQASNVEYTHSNRLGRELASDQGPVADVGFTANILTVPPTAEGRHVEVAAAKTGRLI